MLMFIYILGNAMSILGTTKQYSSDMCSITSFACVMRFPADLFTDKNT